MASVLYPSFKQLLLDSLLTDTIKAVLVDTNDIAFNAAHDFYSDVAAAAIGTPQTLAGKSITGGVFDASDINFAGLTGDPSEAIVIFKDTGNPATSPLIAFIDAATGLPVTPNGGDVGIAWDNGANKIFAI